MTITHYYPWTRPSRFQDEVRQVFGRLFTDDSADSATVATPAVSQWTPRVDVKEEDKRFLILADIPGVDPKDIDVSMDKGVLTIRGERKSESEETNGKSTRVERFHGAFHRSFALPDSADAEGISASGKHGVLEISIPKKAQTTPRRISVNH
jgi:HSP20 family protein